MQKSIGSKRPKGPNSNAMKLQCDLHPSFDAYFDHVYGIW